MLYALEKYGLPVYRYSTAKVWQLTFLISCIVALIATIEWDAKLNAQGLFRTEPIGVACTGISFTQYQHADIYLVYDKSWDPPCNFNM